MIQEFPPHCYTCHFIFDKLGACPHPDSLFIFALISLIPYLIIFWIIIRTLFTRRLTHIFLSLLLISGYLFGDKILKNILRSPRPPTACKNSFGLPSSHMTVMVSYVYYYITMNKTDIKMKIFLVLLCVLQGFARIQLHYHTWLQVLMGTMFGIVYTYFFTKLFKEIYCLVSRIEVVKKLLLLTNDDFSIYVKRKRGENN